MQVKKAKREIAAFAKLFLAKEGEVFRCVWRNKIFYVKIKNGGVLIILPKGRQETYLPSKVVVHNLEQYLKNGTVKVNQSVSPFLIAFFKAFDRLCIPGRRIRHRFRTESTRIKLRRIKYSVRCDIPPKKKYKAHLSSSSTQFDGIYNIELHEVKKPDKKPPEKASPDTAYALLECCERIVVGESFLLEVGLSPVPGEGVAGGMLRRPPSCKGDYILDVQLIADGFQILGSPWRFSMKVTTENPYPVNKVYLKPKKLEDTNETLKPRLIQAFYSTQGHTMGFAVRPVVVLRGRDILETNMEQDKGARMVEFPAGQPAADLTVRITKGDNIGELLFSFDSGHEFLKQLIPTKAEKARIGSEPELFAKLLIDKMTSRNDNPRSQFHYLKGIARDIARKIPAVLWKLLEKLKEKKQPEADEFPPTVLLLSEEPYVPWELALMEDEYLIDSDLPPLLAAQLVVSRWILKGAKIVPPPTVNGEHMVVIYGDYSESDFSNLEHAGMEAGELIESYKAVPVKALEHLIMDCFEEKPPADIMHFAIHGEYAPESIEEGLIMIDGSYLDPTVINGCDLKRKPFVFLNACQVGTGKSVLGNYAGVASAFIAAGASAVIAPLWSIRDDMAREIALEFYQRVFNGESPARVLREKRSGFKTSSTDHTPMAYLFFGHPGLKIVR